MCLSGAGTETHCFSHAPPLLQQFGTSGALAGKAHWVRVRVRVGRRTG